MLKHDFESTIVGAKTISPVRPLIITIFVIDVDTKEVLDAANTKWNFIDFRPGLVGGHCIGIDPYYLTYIAKRIGYSPKIILTGRKINNRMSRYVSNLLVDKMKKIALSSNSLWNLINFRKSLIYAICEKRIIKSKN